ncbi:MAG: enoyl-CoA hydratase-related protein [Kiloniellales bacterium]|nr:enoyl-CoA hydratase-related protein [Kiloniellales bacterium]
MTATDYATLSVERRTDKVLLVRLNRPEAANAFNTVMAEELVNLWQGLAGAGDDIRVVVLTGRGDRAFCAGADLKERKGMSEGAWRRQHQIFEAMAYAIMESPLPTIAAVNGAAFGGGLELVLACDFAYASTSARFAFTEVTLGIIPGIGGTQNLTRAVGPGRARELLMTGAPFGAEDALSWGLINRLYAPEDLLDATLRTAAKIAGNAPLAVAAVRRAAAGALDLPLKKGLALELERYYTLIDTDDRREGIAAFNEKRLPRFKGR